MGLTVHAWHTVAHIFHIHERHSATRHGRRVACDNLRANKKFKSYWNCRSERCVCVQICIDGIWRTVKTDDERKDKKECTPAEASVTNQLNCERYLSARSRQAAICYAVPLNRVADTWPSRLDYDVRHTRTTHVQIWSYMLTYTHRITHASVQANGAKGRVCNIV